MSFQLQSCLSCNCGPVSIIDASTIVYMVANSIVLWDTSQNRKDYLWHSGVGITTCAASHRAGQIAVGEEGSSPCVAVYSYPGKQLQASLAAGATVMYTALAFSHDGNHLITVADYPAYSLKIWRGLREIISVDLEKEPLKIIAQKSIIILFKNEVKLLTIHNAFQKLSKDEEPAETFRYTLKTYPLGDVMPLDATWDKYGNIYLSTNAGELLVLNSTLKEARVIQHFDCNVLSMILTHRYLVTANTNSAIQWLNIFIPPEQHDPREGVLHLRPYKELELEDSQDIIQLLYTADFNKLVLVGAEGSLQVLNVPADTEFGGDEDPNRDDDDDMQDADEEDDDLPKKPKAVTATPITLGHFHVGCVKAVVGLGDSTQCVSIAEDLRVWEIVTGECLSQYHLPGELELTSIDANLIGTLLAVGSSHGALRLFDVSNRLIPMLIGIHRLYEDSITAVLFSPDQRLIALASTSSNQIYFLEASLSTGFRVIGFVEVSTKVRKIAWQKKAIVALLDNSCLAYFDAPRVDLESQLEPFTPQVTYKYIADSNSVQVIAEKIYVAGASKDLLVYNLPVQPLQTLNFSKPPQEPLETISVSQVSTHILAVSPDNSWLAVGSVDGSISLVSAGSFSVTSKQVHGSSGVQSLSFSVDSGLLFSTGQERDFFVWNVGDKKFERPITSDLAEGGESELNTIEDVVDESVRFFREFLAETIAKAEASEIEKVKRRTQGRLEEIREKLQAMLAANAEAPELEQLDRDEFVLDVARKERFEAEGATAAEALRAEARKHNQEQELYRERLAAKTLRSMEVNSRAISSLASQQIVQNYVIRRFSPQEQAFYRKARAFRLTELRESQGRDEEILDASIFDLEWIIGKKIEEFRDHPLLSALQRRRRAALKEGDQEPVPDWELIYPAPLVYTASRKRMQIYMLYLLVRNLKEGFGVKFEEMENLKEKQLDLIEEKNNMIKEKQEELQMIPNVFKAPSHPLEHPEEMLKVDEAEITVEKYLSREEREALEEQRRREEERLRLLNADDSKRQALDQMMHGTIEHKKAMDSVLTKQLQREPWMDELTLQEMTEEQRQKLKEFEESEKKLQEDREKLRKILEGELKKLQGEVHEICKSFDTKVKELFLLRLTTDYEIYQTEMMIAKLTLSLLHDQKRREEVEELVAERARLEALIQAKEDEIKEFADHSEFLQEKVSRLLRDSKTIDTKFKNLLERENIVGAEQKRLMFLLKEGSEKKPGQPSEVEHYLNSLHSLDPFAARERQDFLEGLLPPPPQEIDEAALPPGISPSIVEHLNIDRKKKINYEKNIPQMQHTVRELDRHKKWLDKKLSGSIELLKKVSQELKEKEDEGFKQHYNTHLMLRLKQALVEVPQQPVVTDYSDAILIHREVVETNNDYIRSIGNSKVDILRNIAKFKIDVSRVKWKKELLKLEADDYLSSEGDLKMLRIDKRLQNILAGRGLDENQRMAKRYTEQIEYINDNSQKRVAQLNEKIRTLNKQIEELDRDNAVLENEVDEMKKQEQQRDELLHLRATISDQARDDPMGKFKNVAYRRKMMDTIEQYREEIEFLNDELDRLRAKTFPSFAHLQAHIDYPDEI